MKIIPNPPPPLFFGTGELGRESPNFRTDSLLALDRCHPRETRVLHPEWSRIMTTLKPDVWERALAVHPDREFAQYVCSGIRHGFRIGFNDLQAQLAPVHRNMISAMEHREVVEKYLGEEREAQRVLGPFKRSLFPEVHVSPFGVIPKAESGKWRLILDLSSPRGKSVNDGIARDLCSLSYVSVDDIATRVLELGRGALVAKFDLKSAYRHIPVHPDDRRLLGMDWNGELYLDAALPFGLRSAPMIFNAVAEGLAFVIRQRGVEGLDHYLDDFSLVGRPRSQQCKRNLDVALATCEEVGFQVAPEKTEGPTTSLSLLGIELDTELMQLKLPQKKLLKLRELVEKWRRRKACTKRELQSLAGYLNHACKVIRPGRRFLRGVFGLLSRFERTDHIIRLNAGFRADMEWWHVFAGKWNGVSMLRNMAFQSPSVEIWSDASGSWGCGAVWGLKWFQVKWSKWPGFAGASIAAKELLPIIVAAAIWGPSWKGAIVLCHCDNEAVVTAVKSGYCRDPTLAHMLRCLFFLEAEYDYSLSAIHVPGVENRAADSISRNNLPLFFDLLPQALRNPCLVPDDLVSHLIRDRPWTSEDWKTWLGTLLITH